MRPALALIARWLLIGVAVVRSKRVSSGGPARGRLIRRWLAMSLLAGAVTFGLAGPPLFSTWHAPWAGAQARAATGQTLEQNGGVRIYLWREALIVFEHHPVAGAGFGAMSDEAVKLTPSTAPVATGSTPLTAPVADGVTPSTAWVTVGATPPTACWATGTAPATAWPATGVTPCTAWAARGGTTPAAVSETTGVTVPGTLFTVPTTFCSVPPTGSIIKSQRWPPTSGRCIGKRA